MTDPPDKKSKDSNIIKISRSIMRGNPNLFTHPRKFFGFSWHIFVGTQGKNNCTVYCDKDDAYLWRCKASITLTATPKDPPNNAVTKTVVYTFQSWKRDKFAGLRSVRFDNFIDRPWQTIEVEI
ncbi:hypothetical protein PFISCL1PPCAC_12299, partial [Pristionchus fissidentatus]